MQARDVVPRERVVGAVGNTGVEALERAAEVTLGVLLPALPKIDGAHLDVQLEQGAIAQRMIAGADERHFPLVLTQRLHVLALEIVHVSQPRMRTDDLQAEVPRDVLLLQLDRTAADFFRAIELAVPREEKRELQV